MEMSTSPHAHIGTMYMYIPYLALYLGLPVLCIESAGDFCYALSPLVNSLFDLIWNVDLVEIEHRAQLSESVDVGQLLTKLVANERLEENEEDSDEVGRVHNVQLLQILLVPVDDEWMTESEISFIYKCIRIVSYMYMYVGGERGRESPSRSPPSVSPYSLSPFRSINILHASKEH